jgi:hypothetical protein
MELMKNNPTEKTAQATTPVLEVEPTAGIETEKKKKKKYSNRFSRNLQLLEKAHTKAGKRIANAVAKGFDVWIENRDASAEKRRDGALRDFTKNCSKALRKTLQEGAEAPADFLDNIAKMKMRRL